MYYPVPSEWFVHVFHFFLSCRHRAKATPVRTMEPVFQTLNWIHITVTVSRDLLGLTVQVYVYKPKYKGGGLTGNRIKTLSGQYQIKERRYKINILNCYARWKKNCAFTSALSLECTVPSLEDPLCRTIFRFPTKIEMINIWKSENEELQNSSLKYVKESICESICEFFKFAYYLNSFLSKIAYNLRSKFI